MKFYVAAVLKTGRHPGGNMYLENSQRQDGDWACFVSSDKGKVIEEAIQARDRWYVKGYGCAHSGPYQILVGELTEELKQPVRYELVPLEPRIQEPPPSWEGWGVGKS